MTSQPTPAIITIASSKGGVGKSTVCICLAGALLARGNSVHIIDLDENQTVMRWHTQHRIDLAGLTVTTVPAIEFPAHLRLVTAQGGNDYILIDVAGVYEKAMLQAMGRSNLVIIPAQPSEPDLHEATKVVRDLTDLNDSFNGAIPFRVLLNLFEPLDPHYQRHAVAELSRLQLNRFETVLHKRAAFREAFMTGLSPHFADASRAPTAKAIVELDAIVTELDIILANALNAESAA